MGQKRSREDDKRHDSKETGVVHPKKLTTATKNVTTVRNWASYVTKTHENHDERREKSKNDHEKDDKRRERLQSGRCIKKACVSNDKRK